MPEHVPPPLRIVAVDLAARFSAACEMDVDTNNVNSQWDSWKISEVQFLNYCVSTFHTTPDFAPIALVIEDLPHGLVTTSITSKVRRMQGRLVEKMDRLNYLDRVLFVPPATWQRYHGVFRHGEPLIAKAAREMGYTPPIDVKPFHHEERRQAHKVNTDYVAAFMIATWAAEYYKAHGNLDEKTTSRYTVLSQQEVDLLSAIEGS